MLIRSQNKKVMVNLCAVEAVVIHDMQRYDGAFKVSAEGYMLGEYSSEEKAIKALDLIARYHERGNKVFQMPQEGEL